MKENIIFEDEYIIIFKKPFGILTQKDKFKSEKTILSFLDKYPNTHEMDIITRIDRPVGGLVLISKNKDVSKYLFKKMQDREIKKTYIAVVYGNVKDSDFLINWIMKNQRLNISKIVCKNSPFSKEAKLKYKKIKTIKEENIDLSLIELELITGRHHQIRVQMSNAGFPILGDNKYNKSLNKFKSNGQIALWSYKLEFVHPKTKNNVEFLADIPEAYPFNLF